MSHEEFERLRREYDRQILQRRVGTRRWRILIRLGLVKEEGRTAR